MDAREYLTPTPTPLRLQHQEIDGIHIVTLAGDSVKVLYTGKDEQLASQIFDAVAVRYDQEYGDS